MPLARLENFLKNLNGNTLYVDPNELDATDSIENRGNSRLRPFKTIQRALLEAARFSYVSGSNNDLFDQTTILISPGTHYIDNRPGYYVDATNTIKTITNATRTISEFNILSNFDITDPDNELYVYNSVDGGVILPKGTSLVATDLRKTKIRPLFVPDPAQSQIDNSAIFRLTGSCYFFGFTIYDGDPIGRVYNTYSTNAVVPSYSHHKLTAFEYADGVNKVFRNGSNTGHTDLEMYYYKLSLGFGQQSGRSVIDGYSNFQPNIDEYRIVGELGSGVVNIASVVSGDGITGTNVITVTTETEHNLSPLTPILISGVGQTDGAPTTTEYNGTFIVAQVLSQNEFTYLTSSVPSQSLEPNTDGASLKVVSDTTSSSSPYIFNCSLKSVYGMNGLHADGSKATGFRSMVTAQFTGISLQKDDRAFALYDENTGSYLYQESFDAQRNKFLHQDINSTYRPGWESFHIKASNDAFIQCVSIFAIGYASQFVADDGGDQSITNSNSNFGQKSLYSIGFKKQAFPKDDHGFITHIIPPKDVSFEEQNINTYTINPDLPNSTTKIYLNGFDDVLSPPNSKLRGYSIGGRKSDKIYYEYAGNEYYADINPSYQVRKRITNISNDYYLTLGTISGISTGLAVKIISENSILPDGIKHDKTYFARPYGEDQVLLYENLFNCNSDAGGDGIGAVKILNNLGLTFDNLNLVSKISDIPAGNVGSPIQWDDVNRNWYLSITINSGSPDFLTNITSEQISANLYIKRVIDTRSDDDRSYRVRYVIPKDSENAAVPSSGFILQNSGYPLSSSYSKGLADSTSAIPLTSISAARNKNVIVDAWGSVGTATIVTKNPHGLKVGNKVSIYGLKSSNEPNPIGLGTGTGYNGSFEVTNIDNDITFTYSIPNSVDPGTITSGISSTVSWLNLRNCSDVSRVPPYTVYDDNREDLPYFTCDEIENHYQIYSIKEIQPYVQDSTDGVYYITLDSYKNTPTASPFNTSYYKYGQSLDNIYPKIDFDNLIVDPNPSKTVASRKTIGSVNINDPYLSSSKEIIVNYLKDFNLGEKITGFVQSGSEVTITTEQNHGIAGIRRVSESFLGSGYLDGVYYDIPLCGGDGSSATVNVRVSGGVPSYIEVANPGSGYNVGNTLSIKGIPGSSNSSTVTVASLNFDPSVSDLIQVFGATDPDNNGIFVINSVTENTISYTNTSGVTESPTDAVVFLSGTGYPVTASYNSTTKISTITAGSLNPHSFAVGNKVLFDVSNLGICTVTSVSGNTQFTVNGDASSATRVYGIGLIPTLKDADSLNENLNVRQFAIYGGHKSRSRQLITNSTLTFSVVNPGGFRKGDFISVENEIMMVVEISGSITVQRGLFGTQSVAHPINSAVETIKILPVELRRPSILRASGHTFEYTGFGPGNYSTAMPSNQTKVLSDEEISISQALQNKGGLVVYSGMNSNGQFFIGRKRWDAATGNEIEVGGEQKSSISDFDTLTVNKLIVNQEIDASTAKAIIKRLTVTNNAIFNSNVSVGNDLSVANDLSIGGELSVTGTTTFDSRVDIGGAIKPERIIDTNDSDGAANQVLTSLGGSFGNRLDWRNVNDLVSGRIVQIVSGTETVRVLHTDSWGSTGLSATITPLSTNNKIIILISQPIVASNDVTGGIRIVKNSNVLFNYGQKSFGGFIEGTSCAYATIASIQYIDTAGTTSPITYGTEGISPISSEKFASNTGLSDYDDNPIYAAASSTIFLIEISQ